MAIFRARPLYHRYLGGNQSRSGHDVQKKHAWPCREPNTGRPACCIVTTLNAISRFLWILDRAEGTVRETVSTREQVRIYDKYSKLIIFTFNRSVTTKTNDLRSSAHCCEDVIAVYCSLTFCSHVTSVLEVSSRVKRYEGDKFPETSIITYKIIHHQNTKTWSTYLGLCDIYDEISAEMLVIIKFEKLYYIPFVNQ